jgi:hypothetical protein
MGKFLKSSFLLCLMADTALANDVAKSFYYPNPDLYAKIQKCVHGIE